MSFQCFLAPITGVRETVWALGSVRSFIHEDVLGKYYVQITAVGIEDTRMNKMKMKENKEEKEKEEKEEEGEGEC